ncbi:MAG: MerR family transcriptional regulator [Kofleriaceae bacterium]
MNWTVAELVNEVGKALSALPQPANRQVRAVPDERTIRYYAGLRLISPPSEMRGRTALYGRIHLAQIVAIKRLQQAGRSLSEIQELWEDVDNKTLERMSGVSLAAPKGAKREREREFWKTPPAPPATPEPELPIVVMPQMPPDMVEMRIAIGPNCYLSIAVVGDARLAAADVSALQTAAEPLLEELARRGLFANL